MHRLLHVLQHPAGAVWGTREFSRGTSQTDSPHLLLTYAHSSIVSYIQSVVRQHE